MMCIYTGMERDTRELKLGLRVWAWVTTVMESQTDKEMESGMANGFCRGEFWGGTFIIPWLGQDFAIDGPHHVHFSLASVSVCLLVAGGSLCTTRGAGIPACAPS